MIAGHLCDTISCQSLIVEGLHSVETLSVKEDVAVLEMEKMCAWPVCPLSCHSCCLVPPPPNKCEAAIFHLIIYIYMYMCVCVCVCACVSVCVCLHARLRNICLHVKC